MKLLRQPILSIALIALTTLAAHAIPARPGVITCTQADGSIVSLRLMGDEHFHYLLSDDDLLVVDRDGTYYYAVADDDGNPVASPYRVADAASLTSATRAMLRGLDCRAMVQAMHIQCRQRQPAHQQHRGPGLKNNATFPVLGRQKALVILVDYRDVKFRLADPYAYFQAMLNRPGFNEYGGTGSARDYYIDSSGGNFLPDFDVYGPVTLPHDMAWYGRNESNGNDTDNCRMMVVHACQALDSEIDFTQYDRDGDGTIDNVFIFYAGLGEASSGQADSVWPHSADVLGSYTFDGVTLQHYGCTNEWIIGDGGTGHPDGIGAFCHEFAHVLGLPDLYATAYPTPAPFTPGAWSLLDVGPYNNNGRTPPALELFSRYALGWAEPAELPADADISLAPIGDCGNGYIIRTADDDEYFLIENRQKRGWDRYIPGHGMLVWHVQYNVLPWMLNTVNNDARHQHVDIIEADDTPTEATRAGDTFPGTSCVTAIGATTTPALVAWNGAPASVNISMITEQPDGNVTFRTGVGSTPAATPVAIEATDITPRGFTARWQPSADAAEYRLRVYTTDADGTTTTANGYDGRIVGNATEYTVTGLDPDTRYMYTVTAVAASGSVSTASNAVSVTTGALTHEYIIPEASVTDITSNGFTVSWHAVDGADDYVVNVTRRDATAPETDSETFDGKTAFWYTNSGYFYSASSYVGADAPSLRLMPGEYVMSPMTTGPLLNLGFWHRGRGGEGEARLLVETYADGCWTTCGSIALTSSQGGVTSNVDVMPADARSVRVRLADASGTASAYIDDLILCYCADVSMSPVDGYTGLHTGNVTSYTVCKLQGGADYLVTVSAVRDGVLSMPSASICVSIPGNAGIVAAGADNCCITVNDRTVVSVLPFDVYDVTGRNIAAGVTWFTLPHAGLYIVRRDASAIKISVR